MFVLPLPQHPLSTPLKVGWCTMFVLSLQEHPLSTPLKVGWCMQCLFYLCRRVLSQHLWRWVDAHNVCPSSTTASSLDTSGGGFVHTMFVLPLPQHPLSTPLKMGWCTQCFVLPLQNILCWPLCGWVGFIQSLFCLCKSKFSFDTSWGGLVYRKFVLVLRVSCPSTPVWKVFSLW